MILNYFKNIPRAAITSADNLFCYLFNKAPRRGPLFVNWDITTGCNANCIFCDRWKIKRRELSTDEKLVVIKNLGKSGVWLLSLCGGEPLLTKDLDVILKEIKNQKMMINISTNGLLLKNKAKLLVESDVDFITVSIQSHRPEFHDSIYRVKGAFKRVNDGIDLVKTIRRRKSPRIYGRLVINNLVASDLEPFLEYWAGKVDEIIIQPISENKKMMFKIPKKMRFSKKSRTDFDNFEGILKRYGADNLYNRTIPEYIFEREKFKTHVKCFAGYFFLTLDAEGNVYSCSTRRRKFGNLVKDELIEISKSEKMKKFKNDIKSSEGGCICWHSGSMLNAYLSKILK